MMKKGGKTGVICSSGVRGLCTSQVTPERDEGWWWRRRGGRSRFTNHIEQDWKPERTNAAWPRSAHFGGVKKHFQLISFLEYSGKSWDIMETERRDR